MERLAAMKMSIDARKFLAILAVVAGLVGCSAPQTADPEADKARDFQVAQDYAKEHFPNEWDWLRSYDPVVVDLGQYWGVSFRPSNQYVTGGAPDFHIEKESYRILDVNWAQ